MYDYACGRLRMLNAMCPMVAILPVQNNSGHDLQLRMAEYASAVVASKPQRCFFVSIATDINQAAADAICAQPINAGTRLSEALEEFGGETDHWNALHPHAE